MIVDNSQVVLEKEKQNEDLQHLNLEENKQIEDITRSKRSRYLDTMEIWTEKTRNSKKSIVDHGSPIISVPDQHQIQVCVTHVNKLPKQFALAKELKTHDITNVVRVKYVNPYKILLTFTNGVDADNFISNEHFAELGWKCRKTLEVGLSYGSVKNIDLDLSEKEFMENVKSDVEVISVKRLNRRDQNGWTPSEVMRVGFSGAQLPKYIYIFDLRIQVDQFTFPVTQCSRCWRFGHLVKMCTSAYMICPKCGKHHENCETTSFKCVNCSGDHISLSKLCPTYLKEKKLREIMAEHNCSYHKALTLYVEPSPIFPVMKPNQSKSFNLNRENFVPLPGHSKDEDRGQSNSVYTGVYAPLLQEDDEIAPSYADKISGKDNKRKERNPSRKQTAKQHQKEKGKKREKYYIGDNVYAEVDVSEEAGRNQDPMDAETVSSLDADDDSKSRNNDEDDRPPAFAELLDKLKYIIFIKRTGFAEKIRSVVGTTLDWIILQVVGYISDIPFIKKMFDDGSSS
ncbi:hypothetical protein NE865_09849 [Phthorimaea operculella]|nr:hypothetical protein NE865_09849 [Phthorimaea operculella]